MPATANYSCVSHNSPPCCLSAVSIRRKTSQTRTPGCSVNATKAPIAPPSNCAIASCPTFTHSSTQQPQAERQLCGHCIITIHRTSRPATLSLNFCSATVYSPLLSLTRAPPVEVSIYPQVPGLIIGPGKSTQERARARFLLHYSAGHCSCAAIP